MAWKTGCTSVGELLITRRISAVAVCCSRASPNERLNPSISSLSRSISLLTSAYDLWIEAAASTGVPHSRQNLAWGGLSCLHPGHVMPEPPSGRVGERSEPWAETNRPRLAWSRTRAPAPVQLAGCRRSRLPHRASAVAGSQPSRCPYSQPGVRARIPFLRSDPSRSATLPAAMKAHGGSKGRTHDGTLRPRSPSPPESQRTPPRITGDL